jgi:hypothetical protein
LAQAGKKEQASQVWVKAERDIGTIQDSDQQAWASKEPVTWMASADELEQLMHLMQRSWRKVKTREEAHFFLHS